MEDAIARMTNPYVMNVKARPERVPLGIALLGCFRSPDILAPLPMKKVSDTTRLEEMRRLTQRFHLWQETKCQKDLGNSLFPSSGCPQRPW